MDEHVAFAIDLRQLAKGENERTEWKKNVADIDKVAATLSAFANDWQQIGGGYVVCGAEEDTDENGFPRLVQTGLDAKRIKEVEQDTLITCRTRVFPPITPLVQTLPAATPDRRILVFAQPATGQAHTFQPRNKLPNYYVRVSANTIQAPTTIQRELLISKGALLPWDHRACEGATVRDLDLLALRDLLTRLQVYDETIGVEPYLSTTASVAPFAPSFCVCQSLTNVWRPRNFAMLLFGREPQRFVPGAISFFSEYRGTDRGDPSGERHELAGTLLEQANRLLNLLKPQATTLYDKEDPSLPSVLKYPDRALREAAINALAHRDFELVDPLRITAFSDRIEFVSPGSLMPGVTLEDLESGKVEPRWRNQAVAFFLNRLKLAEGAGQGIKTILNTLRSQKSPRPQFKSDEARTTCVLGAHPRSKPQKKETVVAPPQAPVTDRTEANAVESDQRKPVDRGTRHAIERVTQRARALLKKDFAEQLDATFDVQETGAVAAVGGKHLSERQRGQREKIVAAIEHKRGAGMPADKAVEDYLRDAAFTTLNRFVALKMLEARGLLQECVTRGERSRGYEEFCGMAKGVALLPHGEGYRLYVECLFDELSTEIKVLFDRRDAASVLWPRRLTFEALLELLNVPELAGVWGEDETIGWVYQFFNSQEERRKMRDESQAPRNGRELAVRNQFFTPRYVVQFLTDNTLGRLWYEMRGGESGLGESCEYMVRRPGETWAARAKKDPRDLAVLDPACGSGHFLLYAFDLLLVIYEEGWRDGAAPASRVSGRTLRQDYPDEAAFRRAVPGLILRHNLHGVDIDARCAQIGQLALWLRAQRAYSAMGLKGAERPAIRRSNIVIAEPIAGDEAMVEAFAGALDPPLLGALFRQVVSATRRAGELGVLLRLEVVLAEAVSTARKAFEAWQKSLSQGYLPGFAPEQKQRELPFAGIDDQGFFVQAEARLGEALRRFAESAGGGAGMRRRLFAEDAAQGLGLVELCEKKVDVVLMNPPFGAGSAGAKKELEKAYPKTKNDLYAAFVERGIELLWPRGRLGAITSRTGFFLSSFQKWREEILLKKAPPVVFADLGAGVLDSAMVETAAYCLEVAP